MANARPDLAAGVACLIAQAGIGYCTWTAYAAFGEHWSMILGEPSPSLPAITTVSLLLIRVVPIAAAVVMLIGLLAPLVRNFVLWWSFVVALIEALVLAILMMGLSLPALSILYRLT